MHSARATTPLWAACTTPSLRAGKKGGPQGMCEGRSNGFYRKLPPPACPGSACSPTAWLTLVSYFVKEPTSKVQAFEYIYIDEYSLVQQNEHRLAPIGHNPRLLMSPSRQLQRYARQALERCSVSLRGVLRPEWESGLQCNSRTGTGWSRSFGMSAEIVSTQCNVCRRRTVGGISIRCRA